MNESITNKNKQNHYIHTENENRLMFQMVKSICPTKYKLYTTTTVPYQATPPFSPTLCVELRVQRQAMPAVTARTQKYYVRTSTPTHVIIWAHSMCLYGWARAHETIIIFRAEPTEFISCAQHEYIHFSLGYFYRCACANIECEIIMRSHTF